MNVKDTLIKEFVKSINSKPEKKVSMYYGTIVAVEYDDLDDTKIAYVHLDGSEENLRTPIVEGTEVLEGDRVLVTIENHQAIVLANITSPASARTAKNYMDLSEEDEGLVIGMIEDDDNNFNVLIKADGVYVRDGQDVLAVYGGNGTQLYSDGVLAAEFTPEGIRFFSDLAGYAKDDLRNVNNDWLSSGIIINGTIDGLKLKDATIDSVKIKDSAITTAKIHDAAITTAKIQNAAITSAKIEDAAITNAKIQNAAITNAKIEDAAITNAKIGNAAITSAKIDDAAITTAKIENGAITNAKIGNAAIKSANIEDGAITNAKIGNATIKSANIEDGAITNAKIGNAAIKSANIEDGAITNAKIGNAAITTAKIDNAAITTAKINDAAITTAKIDDAAITNAKIGSAAIGTANIQNAAITTALIANEAVTSSQILSVSANKLTAGTIDASEINVANLRAKNLIVEKMNGQPVLGGYELVNKNSTGYSGKNPKTEGWYEYQNGIFVASTDTTVNQNKAYYKNGNQVALYDQTYIDGLESNLNQRIDGAVETYTGTVVPTLVTYPASDWSNEQMASHVGDIYYVVNSAAAEDGYCYRFAYDNTTSSYKWILIKDSDVTKALSDIDDLQDFESSTTSWIEETDEGLRTIRENHTSLSGVVNKTVKSSVQLWFTKANSTAPGAPTSEITSTSTSGNGWRTVVPTYNASYPYYFYCWQYKFVDDTFGWSAVIYDRATSESEERARTGVANAATADGKAVSAQNTANANIKSSVMLWFTKANDTAPSKPTEVVTTSNASTANAWNLLVPTYNSSYPYYFYCYQQQKGDGSYQWSNVIYDRATTETQNTSRATSSAFANYVSTNDAAIQALQSQVDGQLEIWYGTVTPTTSNTPASGWSTSTDKDNHIGDMYYDTTNGKVYQWTKSGSTYSWTEIPDSSAAAALAAAQDAQATADGKRRVFTSQPTVPYDIGDLWVNGDEVKYATKKRTTGSYTASEWAQTATDDTVANSNIKSNVQLWRTKSSSTAIGKPYTDGSTSYINSTSTAGDTWTTVVPVYNSSYPYYHYCYQQQRGDGKYQWTTPVYDDATSVAMKKAQEALPAADFTTFQSTTFKEVKDTVDEQSSTITTLSNRVDTKADSSTVTTLSNTVNSVSQTATSNSTTLSQLTQTLGTNADGTTKANDIMHRMTTTENDLNGFKTTVSSTYQTKSDMSNYSTTTQMNSAINQKANEISQSVSQTYATQSSIPTKVSDLTNDSNFATEGYADSKASAAQSAAIADANKKLASQFAISSTAKGTAAKVATITPAVTGWTLYTGASITVKFVYENTAATPTLNVNSTGAKTIKAYTGTAALSDKEYKWPAGATMSFVYDGSYWRIQDSTELIRLSSAETSITQTATSIESLAANTETYTKPDGTTATNTIKSAIKQNADDIALRVEKSGVISAINLTSETAKIQASKVEINGTAIFSAISSDVDNAITSKGYQTASQVSSTANAAASAVQSNLDAEINQRKATYAICETQGGTAAKVASCSNFALYTGVSIAVKFTNANTATTPTLNINSTGTKTIKSYTGGTLTAAEYKWAAGAVITFTYDGTYWRMQDGGALQAKVDAASSATSAATSASTASSKASEASTSATNAATSASTASSKASEASTSATNAANSASAASSKATAASNSATAASTSAANAANSATAASDSASDASDSATAASNSASTASSKATAAANSASTASSKATAASDSATSAATSASTASSKATAASNSATSAATSASTASSKASEASTSATNAANSATAASTSASTASSKATAAANSASEASTSATNAANSATAAAEVMGGFTILWNYEAFTTANAGEGYICLLDPATGTRSDSNGWVKWNGTKRTITKQMINPNAIAPYNIPIYVVTRLSSATSTTGTNYIVWYNSGWKYAALPTPSAVGGTWTWNADTDIILGKFVEPSSEAAFTDCEIYNPPLTAKHVTTDTVTARSANAAASAAQTTANNAAPKSSAIARTQRIYWRAMTASGKPSKNTTWLATSGTGYGNWSLNIPQLTSGSTKYPFLYTAVQVQTVAQQAAGTTCTCSDVLIDETETVIDGGTIITGTVNANAINASSGTFDVANIPNLNADKITAGTINISRIPDEALNSNIEVGGTNLIRQPSAYSGTSNGLTWSYDTNTGYFTITGTNTKTDANWSLLNFSKSVDNLKVSVGKTYTLTVYGNQPSALYTQINGKNTSNVYYSLVSVTGTGSTTSKTFTVPSTHDSSATLSYMFVGVNKSARAIDCSFRIKLEKGNKATDWTPAPEDVADDISDAKKTATSFLAADDTGLMIYDGSSGESTSSTVVTNNVFVTPEQVQIRSGTNVLAKYGSSVTIGDETTSHIYMDNDEFMINSVVDGNIIPAFSVQTEAAELTDTSRVRKIINVSTKTLAKTSPTSQTIDINFSNYSLTVTNCDSIFCETFYTKEASLTNWTPGSAFSIDISTIVDAGSNGYTKTSGYFNFKFTYNSSGNKITVNPSISSTTTYKGIYIVARRIDYYQTTTSKRPCYNLGTRAEGSTLGAYSVVMGNDNEASGNYSIATGCHTKAKGQYQLVIGRYNTPSGNNTSTSDTDLAFIIGNGTDDSHRGNTLVATYDGQLTVAKEIWARTIGLNNANGVNSTAGRVYLISMGSTSAGSKSKGIYTVNGASSSSKWVIEIDQNNNCYFNGQAASVSDLKKKDVISDYDWKVDKFIRGLKPIAYYKKHDDGTMGDRIHYGFGAQEVKKLVDDLEFDELGVYHANRIRYDEDGCKCEDGDYHGEKADDKDLAWGLVYEEFIAPMVLEIQRLMDRVDTLEEELKKYQNGRYI